MRRLVVAMLTGAWLAMLVALVLPLPIALVGGRIGTEAATPLFFGTWLLASFGLYVLGSAMRMGATALRGSASALALMALLAAWPPIDATGLGIGAGAALLAAAHVWIADKLLKSIASSPSRRRRNSAYRTDDSIES